VYPKTSGALRLRNAALRELGLGLGLVLVLERIAG
jgi:hypothetical protein